jgi:predicted alpha/beta-fold hydrolase
VRNPHLLTIAAHFWPRPLDTVRYPVSSEFHETEPGVRVLVRKQRPAGEPSGHIVLVHGLESSADAGYMLSMASAALERGYAVDRFQLRSCGGTERLSSTLYHAGLTVDLVEYLRRLGKPAYLVGYSLGGNVALKLAGELGDDAAGVLAGVCAISTPIDLVACGRRIGERGNIIYERRFVRKLARKLAAAGLFPDADLKRARSLWEFDDEFTAQLWGFGSAANYYATQSSTAYLEHVRVPALLIQAKDDPIIPFQVFTHPALRSNPNIELLAPDHGGHLGFLSRRPPRFWNDHVVLEWIRRVEQSTVYTRPRVR